MDNMLKNSGIPAMEPLHEYTDPEYNAEAVVERMTSGCLTEPFTLREYEPLFTQKWALTSLDLIACGGFGQVYKAQEANRNKVALKIVSSKYCTEKTRSIWYRRTQREIAIMESLRGHANIVSLHDSVFFGVENFQTKVPPPYVAIKMEFLPCDMALVTKSRPLSWEELVPMVEQIGGAIRWMHGRAIVHHDLKLANLMCTFSFSAFKIVDFGLARSYRTLEGTVLQTESQWRSGTIRYKSPEKEDRTQPYNPFLADHYAFATAMVASLVGGSTFYQLYDEHKCMLQVFEKILAKESPPRRQEGIVQSLYLGLRALLLPAVNRASLQVALEMCKR